MTSALIAVSVNTVWITSASDAAGAAQTAPTYARNAVKNAPTVRAMSFVPIAVSAAIVWAETVTSATPALSVKTAWTTSALVAVRVARTARRYVLSAAKSVANARTASYAPIVETV